MPLLIEAQGMRLLREQRVKGDPAGAKSAEEAPEAARGKRMPGTEINRVFNVRT